VTPEAERYLEKAQQALADCKIMFGVGLVGHAGRTAYLAGFHAAQAFIFERETKVVKTHSGVRSEFARLTRNEPSLEPSVRAFLGRAYNLKTASDYATGHDGHITSQEAEEAMVGAQQLVAAIEALLAAAT
jgi:uncharacterized protein (UPF0332 family)